MQIRTFFVALAAGALALGAIAVTAATFNPQPDPPGFGIVSINPDQTLRLNVVCWEHDVDGVPPGPCHGEMMFHDMAGNVLARQTVKLGPGQATNFDFEYGGKPGLGILVGIDPCWIPDPGSGRALPTAEVFDTRSGRILLHVNPVTPRISFIAGGARER